MSPKLMLYVVVALVYGVVVNVAMAVMWVRRSRHVAAPRPGPQYPRDDAERPASAVALPRLRRFPRRGVAR